ncbi:MAG: PQQ-like beta-propeller repeat protein [Armatimonadetes bacterium]|nr:PQQ-like beta-propeller repeat protein [Armatimonadota bacterium]
MKSSFALMLMSGLVALGIAQRPLEYPFTEDSVWPQWGKDLAITHRQAAAAGPSIPVISYSFPFGGASDEITHDGELLWVPQAFSKPLYRGYLFLNGETGVLEGTYGPLYGSPTTTCMTLAAVCLRDQNNQPVDLDGDGFPDPDMYVPLWYVSGGKNDILMQTVNPVTGAGVGIPMRQVRIGNNVFMGDQFSYRANQFSVFTGSFFAVLGGSHQFTTTGFVQTPPVVSSPNGGFPFVTFVDTGGVQWYVGWMWYVRYTAAGNPVTYTFQGYNLYPNFETALAGFFGPADAFLTGMPHQAVGSSAFDATNNRIVSGLRNGSVQVHDVISNPQVGTILAPSRNMTIRSLTGDEVMSDSFNTNSAITPEGWTIVAATMSGRLFRLNPAQQNPVVWQTQLGHAISTGPSISINNTAYVTAGKPNARLFNINTQDGTVRWERQLSGPSRCTPLIDRDGNVYVGDDRGNLFSFDPNGTQRWVLAFRYPISVTPILDADGVLHVSVSNRYIVGIRQGNAGGK